MNRHGRPFRGYALGLIVACVSAAAGPLSAEKGGLELTARTPRANILVHEPLVLDLAISNKGATAASIRPLLAVSDARIRITDPAGEVAGYEPLIQAMRERVPRVRLRPGAAYRQRFVLLYSGAGNGEFSFPEPGQYVVQTSYSPSGEVGDVIQAAPLSVRVSAPEGRAAEALGILGAETDPAALISASADKAPGVRRVADEYGDTPYGQYARFFVAKGLARRATRKQRPEPAEVFAELAAADLAFPLADECILEIGRLHLQKDELEDVAGAFRHVVAERPDSPVCYDCHVMLARCRFRAGDPAAAEALLDEAERLFGGRPGSQAAASAIRMREIMTQVERSDDGTPG